jgi:hypothetical protein
MLIVHLVHSFLGRRSPAPLRNPLLEDPATSAPHILTASDMVYASSSVVCRSLNVFEEVELACEKSKANDNLTTTVALPR